jgi:hypothetical protein
MLALSLLLSACNFGQEPEPTPDVGAIFTAAAETVMADFSLKLTQTALAAPTSTPPATNTGPATFAVVSPGTGTPAGTPLATFGVGTQPVILSTATPIAAVATQGDTCYNSTFVADNTYPDGTVVEDDAFILKSWSIQNTGTCTWDDGFSLKPISGSAKGTWVIDEDSEFVEPDEIVEITMELKTPTTGGEWGGCWRMYGDNDLPFGTPVCILVVVE